MDNDNISFFIDDTNINDGEQHNISNLLGDDNEHHSGNFIVYSEDLIESNILNYQMNMTIRQLLQICDYYGIVKGMRMNKCSKDMIINILVDYETNTDNYEIVTQRRLMWFYINELRNDKFMKKHIFW